LSDDKIAISATETAMLLREEVAAARIAHEAHDAVCDPILPKVAK